MRKFSVKTIKLFQFCYKVVPRAVQDSEEAFRNIVRAHDGLEDDLKESIGWRNFSGTARCDSSEKVLYIDYFSLQNSKVLFDFVLGITDVRMPLTSSPIWGFYLPARLTSLFQKHAKHFVAANAAEEYSLPTIFRILRNYDAEHMHTLVDWMEIGSPFRVANIHHSLRNNPADLLHRIIQIRKIQDYEPTIGFASEVGLWNDKHFQDARETLLEEIFP